MYESRAYDNEHGDPVVVLVATGTHDVSRLVNMLNRGNTEQLMVGEQVVRQVRRHNGGKAALRLLAKHGGTDFTEDGDCVSCGHGRDQHTLAAGRCNAGEPCGCLAFRSV